MNVGFPKIDKIEVIGLNHHERKKIEGIINDANFKNISVNLARWKDVRNIQF